MPLLVTDDADPVSSFDEMARSFYQTESDPRSDAPSTMIPAPGYFTGRMEAMIDLMRLEAERIDSASDNPREGIAPSALMLHYQTSLGFFLNMAHLSANYYMNMAQVPVAEPVEVSVADVPPPGLEAPVSE
jgi:hypothetical protein